MSKNEARSGGLGMFCLGLVFGAALAGVGVYLIKQREIQRRTATNPTHTNSSSKSPDVNSTATPAADRIRQLGDQCVEDLRADRLDNVYRLTSPAYQQRVTPQQFQDTVHRVPHARKIPASSTDRESAVRKLPEGNKWEYTSTSKLADAPGTVTMTVTYAEIDGDWRIDNFELRQSN
jgi:hypothetical protein